MNTVDQIITFFSNKSNAEAATEQDIIDLMEFCDGLDELKIVAYINTLSINSVSEIEHLRKQIYDCYKLILYNEGKYREMEIDVKNSSNEDKRLKKCVLLLEKNLYDMLCRKEYGMNLDEPYEYFTEDSLEVTQDIDTAIENTSSLLDDLLEDPMLETDDVFLSERELRYMLYKKSNDILYEDSFEENIDMDLEEIDTHKEDINIAIEDTIGILDNMLRSERPILMTGMVSTIMRDLIRKSNIALATIKQYIEMESTVFKATKIEFDKIIDDSLVDLLNKHKVFDKKITNDSLKGILTLSENFKNVGINKKRQVYVYALIKKIRDEMNGYIANEMVLSQWQIEAYSYFGITNKYIRTHKNDFLHRNHRQTGVNKFDEDLYDILKAILASKKS